MLLPESCRQLLPSRSISRSRTALLAGASALALMAASAQSEAGDILRGNKMAAPVANVTAQQAAAMQEAQRAAVRTQNSLARATQAMQAMRAAQKAARDLALKGPSAVPNGLGEGGLVVASGATPGVTDGGDGLWQGADVPTQQQQNGRTEVTVKQNEKKAILTWESFNVGRETDLQFDQSAGGAGAKEWIALNRVEDPSAAPSKILGSIKAEGQVYIINRNGIVFGGSSQVNTSSLVASSLKLSNEQFMAGLNTRLMAYGSGNSVDDMAKPTFGEFGEASNIYQSADQQPTAPYTPGEAPGDVIVAAGAVIETESGGKAMMFAPHIVNSGTISASEGQIILAAGENVYLHQSLDVRGLDVAVSAPSEWLVNYYQIDAARTDDWYSAQKFVPYVQSDIMPAMQERAASVGYSVVNNGIVSSERGDITLQGRDIVQNGTLYATTALNNRSGSIRLQAWEQGQIRFDVDDEPTTESWLSSGGLVLKPGSITFVEPDLDDASELEMTSVATRYEPGRVELHGKTISIEDGAGIVVPAGAISVVASANPVAPSTPDGVTGGIQDGSSLIIESGAYLSTAGLTDIELAMESNVIEVELRINELRDSVLYRDSWLRGTTVYVDKRKGGFFSNGPMAGVQWGGEDGEWFGTPLADVSAWIGLGKTNLGELSTIGGTVTLKSGGSLVTRPDSLIDVSGGSVTYADGYIKTTRLRGADGRLYDIGSARPDMAYVGIAGQFTQHHERWGVSETWQAPLAGGAARFEKGYTEGRDGGSIKIVAGEATVLEGSYAGDVITGERQALFETGARAGKLVIGDGSNTQRKTAPISASTP